MARLAQVKLGDSLEGAPEPTMSAPATPVIKAGRSKRKIRTPFEEICEKSAQALDERSLDDFNMGLKAAYQEIYGGYSLDRVIADPEINEQFESACIRRGLPGDITAWNRGLFRLRKTGQLADVHAEIRTEFSWEQCDAFLFASEIAWRQMIDQGHGTLDDILCDPDLARQFDSVAMAWAPGQSVLQYRWGALKLRKDSKKTRNRARLIRREKRFIAELSIDSAVQEAPATSGVYLLVNDKNMPIYAGGSFDLRGRVERQFTSVARQNLKRWGDDFTVKYFTTKADSGLLLAYQSRCVARHNPELNVPETVFS
jgi:site-specific DNA-methyltransferase (adenine-specific)